MMQKVFLTLIMLSLVISCKVQDQNNTSVFTISDKNQTQTIFVDSESDSLILWAVNDVANNIESITGFKPKIISTDSYKGQNGIYVGTFNSKLLSSDELHPKKNLSEQWEQLYIGKHKNNLIISGSDIRGTVYGIFEFSERLGISPWTWWADATPTKKESLVFEIGSNYFSEKPSVKYRGIFLNDEDWGLQPWAAKTFEQETGDIGPKTYEKIFQLLLKLKANCIWPAMHPSTKAFYKISGNKEMADKYKIVVGSSHAEPMGRNNVYEWKRFGKGAYNYFTNKENVYNYWDERITELKDSENIVSVGMRGIHDGAMYGGDNIQDKVDIVEKIMDDQRELMAKRKGKPAHEIPQNIILYKEVLNLYNAGLEIPDDVTIMWCDDNYGYIRRLSDENEQKRKGGAGIYYHLSYWGSPHDYLWLSSTQPALVWYEMSRAYDNGARKTWIVNVGDIKPSEYNMEFFLDLAWDVNSINSGNIGKHLENWAAREFDASISKEITEIMNEFYRLSFIRKPEFMGWSRVEPQTAIKSTKFNSQTNGNEVLRRINDFQKLFDQVDRLKSKVGKEKLDAWFQLVEYPVKGAALINHKLLYAQLAREASSKMEQQKYMNLSKTSFNQIEELTSFYNNNMASGKWNHMMSMKPRDLSVFDMPKAPEKLEPVTSNNTTQQRIFLNANNFTASNGKNNYSWKSIDGLGYSARAITLLPLKTAHFEKEELPFVTYEFNAEETGEFELQVRCLPTHSNNYDHELGIQLDNEEKKFVPLNTKGRSKEWKNNIIRNSRIVSSKFNIKKKGKHTIKLFVNQTGIVIDQLAINFNMNESFYEIPIEK